ncbi:MAG: hypothetical protein HY744_19875 [Deltaproteobacteria bacterium]|nr:hypothetical protein [Deltaproteobacteria bacterium]
MSTLDAAETERFYRIWCALLSFANEHLQLVAPLPARPAPGSLNTADAATVRDGLWKNDALLERFVTENAADLGPPDLATVASWCHRVSGDFFVVRHLKRYSMFLQPGPPDHVYGVVGMATPLADLLPSFALPIMLQAVLLPFDGRIIYDSLFSARNVVFGRGARRNLLESARRARSREGIITTLGESPRPTLGRKR